MEDVKFENVRSVKFALDSFAVPVIKPKTKNTIYTERVQNLLAGKNKLNKETPAPTHGYATAATWRNYTFAGGSGGMFASDESLVFSNITRYYFPTKMLVKNNRLFAINSAGATVYYSVDLSIGGWNPSTVMEGVLHIPNEFGKCVGLSTYKNDLLLVCENALAAVDKRLNMKFLTDNTEVFIANLTPADNKQMWESGYFGLGYATDTQVLREVLLRTSTPLSLFAISNKIEKVVNVAAGNGIQKIKMNVRGDVFKLKVVLSNSGSFTVSNVSAVISFGKRG